MPSLLSGLFSHRLTATDYSVAIRNPPPDAYDPDGTHATFSLSSPTTATSILPSIDLFFFCAIFLIKEWRDFFSQFAEKQVTAVTIALNNEKLLHKLIARRYHLRDLRLMLPKGADLENENAVRLAVSEILREQESERRGCFQLLLECTVFPILRLFGMFLPPNVLCDRSFKLREEIRELQKEKYDVATVFVTFETEEGQRAALTALATGKIDQYMNNTSNHAPGTLFKDRILRVELPPEPNSVRYLDLSARASKKLFVRIVNFVLTICIVGVCGFAVQKARQNVGTWFSGPLVSIFNSIIPLIIKILMIFEPHSSEGSYQASLYLKITLFRWINTAILTKIITPFTSTVSPVKTDVLAQINAIMWSELWLVPGLRLLDLWGNIKKHFFAPRARNQEIANLSFQGTFYNMGERSVLFSSSEGFVALLMKPNSTPSHIFSHYTPLQIHGPYKVSILYFPCA